MFHSGIYRLVGIGDDGKVDILGKIIIKDDAISYPTSADRLTFEHLFPEGKINAHTASQLNKYLHDHHGHSYLELDGSVNS